MKPVRIALVSSEALSGHRRLFDALGELYTLQFVARDEGKLSDCAAALLFGQSRDAAERIAGSGIPCLAFLGQPPVAVRSETADLSMAALPCLDRSFRGRVIRDRSIKQLRELKSKSGDEVITRKGEDILWIHRVVGKASIDLLAVDLPSLGGGEYLYQFLQRDNFMHLLPLMHFLRGLSPWKRPPLRGCLMFDDPNLHWKTYGCVRYEEMARHARAHNYHVSFATVPFDGWYVHPATAALFRAHKDRLSLLVHGNNHTYAELAQDYPVGHRLGLMAQALLRIARLEARSGLEISRIMAAPHGGCSQEMAAAMLQVGFEAACISRWSLMHYNQNRDWPQTVGLNPAEYLETGFPVIPRFKLAHEREVDVYLAALLQKPIILVGHHDDVSGGLDIMKQFADRINSVGNVSWMNMRAMARSNFCTHQDGDTLHVKMYSRRVQVGIPSDAVNLIVHRAWFEADEHETLELRYGQLNGVRIDGYRAGAIKVNPGTEIELTSVVAEGIDPQTVRAPRTSFWAGARRGFCEFRDRARPIFACLRKVKPPARAGEQST